MASKGKASAPSPASRKHSFLRTPQGQIDRIMHKNSEMKLKVEAHSKLGHGGQFNSGSGLSAYTTLPVAKELFKLPHTYNGWEFRSRPTAITHDDIDKDEESVVLTLTRRKPGASPAKTKSPKKAGQHHGNGDDTAATAGEGNGDAQQRSQQHGSRASSPVPPPPPADRLALWVNDHAKVLLGALSSSDKSSKGLLAAPAVRDVFMTQACPELEALDEALATYGQASFDYAKFIHTQKTAGQTVANRQRAGPGAAAAVSPTAPKLAAIKTLRKYQDADTKALRDELAKIDALLRQEKERHDLVEAEVALRRMQLDQLKTPAAKNLMRDAYLTYSPSRKQAFKALEMMGKK